MATSSARRPSHSPPWPRKVGTPLSAEIPAPVSTATFFERCTRDAALLTHVLCGDLLILLVPVSKLSHMALLPLTQLVSELSWHFPPDAGHRVAVVLGKEQEPV